MKKRTLRHQLGDGGRLILVAGGLPVLWQGDVLGGYLLGDARAGPDVAEAAIAAWADAQG